MNGDFEYLPTGCGLNNESPYDELIGCLIADLPAHPQDLNGSLTKKNTDRPHRNSASHKAATQSLL